MSISSTHTAEAARHSTKQKVGLVICGLYSLANIPSVLIPEPESGESPPVGILVIGSILGVVGLVAAILAWRGNDVAMRVAAGSIIVVTLTGLPAFFVDVPMAVKLFTGVAVLLTVAAVVLMFSGDRRPASVTD
jgi:hypothetical protein